MDAVRGLLAALSAGLLVAGCGNPTATLERVVAGDPAKPYLGKTKAEIVACAGEPSASVDREGSEVLVYHYSGSGPVPGAAKKKQEGGAQTGLFGGKKDKNWECSASITFENGRLTRLTFAPRDVVSPYSTPKTSAAEKQRQREARRGAKKGSGAGADGEATPAADAGKDKSQAAARPAKPTKAPEACTFVLPACGG
jgi:hypothetical protein